jgi:peptidoglycan/xylan/chitin deacetylase (PgdA/CDA1 family)
MNVPCPVHGSKRAHRSCHRCRKPICRLCELKLRGHLYCSTRCSRDDARAMVWRRVRQRIGRPVPARIAVAAVLAAAAAPAMTAVRAARELDRLNAAIAAPSPIRRASAPRIESVVDAAGARRVEGRAPEGSAVFLFADTRLVATVASIGGKFRFDDVRAPGSLRVGAMPLSVELPVSGLVPAPAAAVSPVAAPPLPSSGAAPAVSRFVVPDFTRGPADRREILVSFDAGSSERGALDILNALRERRITTTVFLTGDFIRKSPAIARRIAADGHEVGNHTDTHPHLTTFASDGRQATRPGVDREFLVGELTRAARLYREATGREMAPVWRAPFGEQNPEIRGWAAQAGFWHVGWTGGRAGLDGLDWVTDPRSPAYRTADRVVELLLERAENGGIVLLHLGSDRPDPVARRVPALLDGLAARGFRFARATELLDRAGDVPERRAAIAGFVRRQAP